MQSESTKYFNLPGLFEAWNKVQPSVYRKSNSQSSTNISDNQNKLFLIFGITTSGKTVTQYYLCQDNLEFGIEENKKLAYMVPAKQYLDATVLKDSNKITTRCPNIRTHNQPSSQVEQNKKVVFVEIPDIKELKDNEKTYQHFFINRIFKQFHSVHLLIVVTQQGLDDGASLIQNFQCITSLFNIQDSQVEQKLSKNLSIIINKSDPKKDSADVKEKLQDLNNEVIQQQNQPLFNIIDTIIRDQRVYIIKQQQPQDNQQKELFQQILEKSQCADFNDLNLVFGEIQDLVTDDDTVKQMLQEQQVVQEWQDKVKQLFLISRYLSDYKNRYQNFSSILPILRDKLTFFWDLLNEEQRENIQNIQFLGKLSQTVKSALLKMVRASKASPQQCSSSLFTINTLKKHLLQIKFTCFEQIGIYVRQQLKSPQSSDQISSNNQQPQQKVDQKTQANVKERHNQYYVSCLGCTCLDMCNLIDYLGDILDYTEKNGQSDGNASQYHEFQKQSLCNLTAQLVAKFREHANELKASWLSPKKKNNSKSPRKSLRKKPNIVKISFTIQKLKQQIFSIHKSKPYESLLNQIFRLPNTHFKLYMLCLQFPSDIATFIEREFKYFLQIVREISEVLRVGKLYLEQIKFLLLVPDWNRVQTVVVMLKKQERKGIQVQKGDIEFLNKLGVYSKQMRRDKLSQNILSYVDELLAKTITKNPEFSAEQFTQLRQKMPSIDQNFFQVEAMQLYSPNLEGLPRLVELFKQQQTKIWPQIYRTNQFLHLIKQSNL